MEIDCPFCKIFRGDLPARIIYQDTNTVGFVDITPRFAKGQCVVVHKKHVVQFYELEDNEIAELFQAVKRVAQKLHTVFQPDYVCLFSRGQSVAHAHIIVYPSSPLGTLDGVLKSIDTTRRLVQEEMNENALNETARLIRGT